MGHTSRVRDVCSPHSRLWHHHLLRGAAKPLVPEAFSQVFQQQRSIAQCALNHACSHYCLVLSPSEAYSAGYLDARSTEPIYGEFPRDCVSHYPFFGRRCFVNTSQLTRLIDDISHRRGLLVFSHPRTYQTLGARRTTGHSLGKNVAFLVVDQLRSPRQPNLRSWSW